ncbi:hypothetical protein [Amycolatopsis sp. NPDC059657]|uniref:hypothetical protein n=1 Tax=Amycolatopsis sp. NPDC059657 TaxID=3346899 RepID=UPI00366DF5B2
MRKSIAAVLLALAAITGSVTPASAATETTAAGCSTDMKAQADDGITVWVYYTTFSGECYVDRVLADRRLRNMYGHFNMFGPDGFYKDSVTKMWTTSDGYNEYPRFKTHPGDLWCAKFYDGNNNPVTRAVCVTV